MSIVCPIHIIQFNSSQAIALASLSDQVGCLASQRCIHPPLSTVCVAPRLCAVCVPSQAKHSLTDDYGHVSVPGDDVPIGTYLDELSKVNGSVVDDAVKDTRLC
jgi:hypothetical protein